MASQEVLSKAAFGWNFYGADLGKSDKGKALKQNFFISFLIPFVHLDRNTSGVGSNLLCGIANDVVGS